MYKKILSGVLIMILLILAGCNLGRGPTDKTKGELITPTEAKHRGFAGLDMAFVQAQPPDTVWENSEFPITVKIKNNGANDIQRGILTVTGNLHFSTITDLQFSLEGKSEFNPDGEFSFENFPSSTVEVNEDRADSFFLMACYQYKTDASVDICINPRVIDTGRTEGECKVGSIALSGGQGAPVAVMNVEEQIIPIGEDRTRIILKILISNKGGGRVVTHDSYMKGCGGQAFTPQEIGEIRVDNIQFSKYRLGSDEGMIICPNLLDNKFRLNPTGDYLLECFADLDLAEIGPTAFKTPLITELSYGYTQLAGPKTITIKNSPIQ